MNALFRGSSEDYASGYKVESVSCTNTGEKGQ